MTGSNGTTLVPRTLPPLPSIIDRDPVIQWILDRVNTAEREDRPCRLWLTGVPGVGKSALATAVAHQLADRCPDGLLFHELGGSTANGPADPTDVQAVFLRRGGCHVPDGHDERRMAYADRYFGLRTLIVLDDAAGLPQVKALLPSSQQAIVIVTSIARHSGIRSDGFEEHNLEPFEPPFSTALLARHVGSQRVADEPEAAAALTAACGHLPLGIEVLAALIASRPHRRLDTFVAPLQADPDRARHRLFGDSPLFVPFEFVLRTIRADLARSYLTLSLHHGPVLRVRIAAAMLGLTDQDAEDVLDDLAQANLLQRTVDGGYRFHAFAAWYVREKAAAELPQDDQIAAVRAMVTCRLHWTVGLALSLWPKRPWIGDVYTRIPATYPAHEHASAAAEFETEYDNILATVYAAARTGSPVDCVSLGLAFKQWCYETARTGDLVAVMECVATAVDTLDDPRLAAWVFNELGTAYEAAHEFEKSIAAFRRSAALAREVGDLTTLASDLEWQAIVTGQLDDPAAALGLLHKAWTIASSADFDPDTRPRMLAMQRMHLARMLVALGQYELATDEAITARRYFVDHHDPINTIRTSLVLNDALIPQGRVREATEHLSAALTSADPHRLRTQQMQAWQAIAANQQALRTPEAALNSLEHARTIAVDLSLIVAELNIIVSTADVHRELGNLRSATDLLRSAGDTATRLGSTPEHVAILLDIAATYDRLNDTTAANACRTAAMAVTPQRDSA